jgi:hypothetical protein
MIHNYFYDNKKSVTSPPIGRTGGKNTDTLSETKRAPKGRPLKLTI